MRGHCTVCQHVCLLHSPCLHGQPSASFLANAWLSAGLGGESHAVGYQVILSAELCHASPFYSFQPPAKANKNPKSEGIKKPKPTKQNPPQSRTVVVLIQVYLNLPFSHP